MSETSKELGEYISRKSFQTHMRKHLLPFITTQKDALLYYMLLCSELAHSILEGSRHVRNQLYPKKALSNSEEELLIRYLKEEVALSGVIAELDKNIINKTLAMSPDLESKVLKCAREAFPTDYYDRFARRWLEPLHA